MSKRIAVGMMVRVRDEAVLTGKNTRSPIAGKIGRVIGFVSREMNETRGFVDNFWLLDISHIKTSECLLEPHNPDSDQSTWEEVQKLTNWNPTKATA